MPTGRASTTSYTSPPGPLPSPASSASRSSAAASVATGQPQRCEAASRSEAGRAARLGTEPASDSTLTASASICPRE
eukprot:scaffold17427_cov54-Phaeocystis_antarctica.AAC.2